MADNNMTAKVLGGAAAGVGIVAMAPVFGAIGTVTALGSLLGMAAGASAGAALSASDEVDKSIEVSKASKK